MADNQRPSNAYPTGYAVDMLAQAIRRAESSTLDILPT